MFVAGDFMSPQSPTPRLAGHIPALDGIRGLAILLVMIQHLWIPLPETGLCSSWLNTLAGLGWTGVDLFFVLSGFLITGILIDAKGTPHFFQNFYMRRILRIFPLYYGVLVVVFLIVYHIPPLRSRGVEMMAQSQLWAWLYGTNILTTFFPERSLYFLGHFWSLAVEEHFYFVWPFLIWFFSRTTMIRLCLSVLIAALLLRVFMAMGTTYPIGAYILTPCRMDSLALGALLSFLLHNPRGTQHLRLPVRWIALASLSILLVLFYLRHGLNQTHDPLVQTLGFTLLSLFFGAVIFLTLHAPKTSLFSIFFGHPGMRFLGKYAYGLYVFHFPLSVAFAQASLYQRLHTVVKNPILTSFLFFMLGLAFSLLIAITSFHLFENPFLKLKRYFEYRSKTPDIPTPLSELTTTIS